MNHRISLVVFDMGGVLVRTGHTWAEDAALAGYTFSPEWLEQFEAKRVDLPRLGTGLNESQHYFELLAQISDGALTAQDARRITRASPIAEYLGVGRVLDALDATGIETALLMNITEVEWERIFVEDAAASEFPTVRRIVRRFSSHLMQVQKPDARAYLEVERATGHTGDAILFFDDRAENVEAARSRGWTAEQIDHTGDTATQLLEVLRAHGIVRIDSV